MACARTHTHIDTHLLYHISGGGTTTEECFTLLPGDDVATLLNHKVTGRKTQAAQVYTKRSTISPGVSGHSIPDGTLTGEGQIKKTNTNEMMKKRKKVEHPRIIPPGPFYRSPDAGDHQVSF